jgi:SNF2 family DNA or RNA helicase
VEPLPHQITAGYEEMLPRQPLRFLLADDPGAGKTIMAGLLIKELIARGDLHRCLIVCPGSLAEQWQDELYRRFHLPFEILTSFCRKTPTQLSCFSFFAFFLDMYVCDVTYMQHES